jgi:hypothetical protein
MEAGAMWHQDDLLPGYPPTSGVSYLPWTAQSPWAAGTGTRPARGHCCSTTSGALGCFGKRDEHLKIA